MTSQTLQDSKLFNKNNLLRNFTAAHRNQLPVLTRLLDWEGPPTVLENHKVSPGTELVLHGWTRQSKVLATTDLSSTSESSTTASLIHNSITRHYAIPLTYQGEFQLITTQPRISNGGAIRDGGRIEAIFHAVDLVALPHGASVSISNVPPNDVRSNAGLKVGDVLYINSVRGHHPNAFISCEKLEVDGQLTAVNISSNSSMTFTKNDRSAKNNARVNRSTTDTNGAAAAGGVNIDGKALTIRDLVPYLSATRVDAPLEVELVRYGGDHTVDGVDLPLRQVIVLKGLIVEPAVYTSVKTPVAPSFHVPMRALLYVRLLQTLDRQSSPLLTKDHPKLSTLDRCVELLSSEIFHQLCSQSQSRLGSGDNQAGTLRSLSSSAVVDGRNTSQRSMSAGQRASTQRSVSYPWGDTRTGLQGHLSSSKVKDLNGAPRQQTETSKGKNNGKYEKPLATDFRTSGTGATNHRRAPSVAESEVIQSRSLWSRLSSKMKKGKSMENIFQSDTYKTKAISNSASHRSLNNSIDFHDNLTMSLVPMPSPDSDDLDEAATLRPEPKPIRPEKHTKRPAPQPIRYESQTVKPHQQPIKSNELVVNRPADREARINNNKTFENILLMDKEINDASSIPAENQQQRKSGADSHSSISVHKTFTDTNANNLKKPLKSPTTHGVYIIPTVNGRTNEITSANQRPDVRRSSTNQITTLNREPANQKARSISTSSNLHVMNNLQDDINKTRMSTNPVIKITTDRKIVTSSDAEAEKNLIRQRLRHERAKMNEFSSSNSINTLQGLSEKKTTAPYIKPIDRYNSIKASGGRQPSVIDSNHKSDLHKLNGSQAIERQVSAVHRTVIDIRPRKKKISTVGTEPDTNYINDPETAGRGVQSDLSLQDHADTQMINAMTSTTDLIEGQPKQNNGSSSVPATSFGVGSLNNNGTQLGWNANPLSGFQIPPGYALVSLPKHPAPPNLIVVPSVVNGGSIDFPPTVSKGSGKVAQSVNGAGRVQTPQRNMTEGGVKISPNNNNNNGVNVVRSPPSEHGGAVNISQTRNGSGALKQSTSAMNDVFSIPSDGNLYDFNVKQFAQFLRSISVEDDVIDYCYRHRLDGRKFSTLSEKDLKRYRLEHPLIMYFRQRTTQIQY